METLYFITAHGVCGYTATWETDGAKYDAQGWIDKFGDRIGSGSAPIPCGGFIDLSQFSTVTMTR